MPAHLVRNRWSPELKRNTEIKSALTPYSKEDLKTKKISN